MTDEGPRYAIYYVPLANSDLYRFGRFILGYDCYTATSIFQSNKRIGGEASWDELTEEPRRYGFHATLKAPFRLSPNCTESQLANAVSNFASLRHPVPEFAPIIGLIDGFAAVLPREHVPAIEAMTSRCTMTFDSFRAPMSPQERARRLAVGLDQDQIENLDQQRRRSRHRRRDHVQRQQGDMHVEDRQPGRQGRRRVRRPVHRYDISQREQLQQFVGRQRGAGTRVCG